MAAKIKDKTVCDNSVDLTIIIISYNTLEMTKECIESVLANTYELQIQIVLVDNASDDGSPEMVQSLFPTVELIRNSTNKGFAAANNQGFKVVRGEFVLLLNSDTIILADAILKSVNFMKTNPTVGALGCRILNTDMSMQRSCSGFPTFARLSLLTIGLDKLKVFSKFDKYLYHHWERNDFRDVEVISGCYLMVRGEVLEKVGGLDERFFFFGEETDWCWRIHEAGWRLTFIPTAQIIHHGGGSVKKMQYVRDVMLTAATVNLHRKYNGIVGAISVYVLLMTFNISRMIIWSICSILKKSNREKAIHFFKVTKSFRSCWVTDRS